MSRKKEAPSQRVSRLAAEMEEAFCELIMQGERFSVSESSPWNTRGRRMDLARYARRYAKAVDALSKALK